MEQECEGWGNLRGLDGDGDAAWSDAPSAEEEIKTVLAERKKLYEAVADLILKTGDSAAQDTVGIILQKLKEKHIIEK